MFSLARVILYYWGRRKKQICSLNLWLAFPKCNYPNSGGRLKAVLLGGVMNALKTKGLYLKSVGHLWEDGSL